jgi:transposase
LSNGSGLSRGDRNRNARLERLRALVPAANAITGIDLAGSKQGVVVTDNDSRAIVRRVFRCRAWDLGAALDRARGRAAAAGRAGVTVSCEPTGTAILGGRRLLCRSGQGHPDLAICTGSR